MASTQFKTVIRLVSNWPLLLDRMRPMKDGRAPEQIETSLQNRVKKITTFMSLSCAMFIQSFLLGSVALLLKKLILVAFLG